MPSSWRGRDRALAEILAVEPSLLYLLGDSEEDQVVHLLAGLTNIAMVTALESGSETAPPLESVTERLLRKNRK